MHALPLSVAPAERAAVLRRGADSLETIARAAGATGISWQVAPHDPYTVQAARHDPPAFVASAATEVLADYLALLSPRTGLTIAWMLRQVAHETDAYDELEFLLPPGPRRLIEKRAVWAGELAAGFLRSTHANP